MRCNSVNVFGPRTREEASHFLHPCTPTSQARTQKELDNNQCLLPFRIRLVASWLLPSRLLVSYSVYDTSRCHTYLCPTRCFTGGRRNDRFPSPDLEAKAMRAIRARSSLGCWSWRAPEQCRMCGVETPCHSIRSLAASNPLPLVWMSTSEYPSLTPSQVCTKEQQ